MKQTYEDTTAIGAEGKRLVISLFREQVSVFFTLNNNFTEVKTYE